MLCVTEAGLFHLMLLSRSPKAQPFRRWLCHEVLPTIHRFGYYDPALVGATPDATVKTEWRRYRQHRAALLARDADALAASGLLTVAAFRLEHGITARDALSFASQVGHQARLAGVRPRRFFRDRGMRSAWPKELLFLSLVNFQPRLALPDSTQP